MGQTTNKGKYKKLGIWYRTESVPTTWDVVLALQTMAPDSDTDTVGAYQIATGNGYTDGGYELTPGATDFSTWTEDDTNNWALVQTKDVTWTATGGSIPSSGNGARYACLCDDNATTASKEVYEHYDLTSERTATVGQALTLTDIEVKMAFSNDTAFITNRGLYTLLGILYRAQSAPTTWDAVLCLATLAPDDNTNVVGAYQIATGTGYTDGGESLTPGATDFDVWTEDDTNDWALVQAADITWTAASGSIPTSGNGARYLCWCDDDATTANKEIFQVFDLVSERIVTDGNDLTVYDCEFKLAES